MRAGPRRNVRNHGGGKGRPPFGGLLSRGASRFRLEELEEPAINPQGKNANRGMERRIFSRRKSARIQRQAGFEARVPRGEGVIYRSEPRLARMVTRYISYKLSGAFYAARLPLLN